MPCISDYQESSVDHTVETRKQQKKLKRELDKVTAHLCLSCKTLDKNGIVIPKSVQTWWKKHQEFDKKRLATARKAKAKRVAAAERKQRESERKAAALKKLTPAERKLLRLS